MQPVRSRITVVLSFVCLLVASAAGASGILTLPNGFQLYNTGIDLTTFQLQGFWVTDNQGLDILVNGNSTGQTNLGLHGNPVAAHPGNAFQLGAADGLVAGPNTIVFEWGNGPAAGAISQFPNPVHARVQFIPEPATALLLGLGLGGLARASRPRRA